MTATTQASQPAGQKRSQEPNWLRHLSEGSDAEQIVRKSPCLILVVYEGEELQAG
jgi:hypothetical protein